jgi:hypothetical protein
LAETATASLDDLRRDIEVGQDLFESLSSKLSIKCSLTPIALQMDEL